ncbi:MAG: sigma-54-dependent Fis family transcriptional regulator [Candidatus Omnitrophota bacterium]|jgi:DNA-binding NtrC family response regulator|nr:MAG: sigma-54-dependent Fis family transcriptional regulator [Candidatus Omnitrophota bacterium]
MNTKILLVEDDLRFASRLKKNLSLEGYEVHIAASGEDALDKLDQLSPHLILSDIKMPGMNGLDLLGRLNELQKAEEKEIPVVLLTSVDSVRVAVDAMKAGAADYITKDADRDEIILRIDKVLAGAKVRAENKRLRRHIRDAGELGRFIAVDPKMKAILDEIDEVAGSGANVLIVGETGAGKELVARYLHRKSPRNGNPFIDINCAALPTDNLFQSEVFGHEKGAFTGATARKRGKLELADEGTLFLDEIGDMPLESQGKILRALETKEFERLGGSQKIQVDIAVLAATNKDLHAEVQAGCFRQDLLYRLDIIRLHIPPLRDRRQDIDPLLRHFFEEYAQKYRRPVPQITANARTILEHYAWPGNVRELKNLVERITIRNRECTVIDEAILKREGLYMEEEHNADDQTSGSGASPGNESDDPPSLEEIEKQAILTALQKADWVQSEAARLLKISPDRINTRIKKYKISHPSWRTYKPT